jgi:acetoin utilization deacetylase AcuC-like enzyme
MKRTGVFYHDICGKEAYKSLAMSVEEGFFALKKENIFSGGKTILFESLPAKEEEIRRIHSQKWIDTVKRTQWWKVSLYSIGGLIGATEKVIRGEIDNALVFIGVGGHHAHRDNAWGGCYFNMTAIAIDYAREKLGSRRFAIVDTDTHHADGTRDIFEGDDEVLHICLCGWWGFDYNHKGMGQRETKICLSHGSTDDEEIEIVRNEVPERVAKFKPVLIYWIMGLDTHRDSYGTMSLSERCYPELAKILKDTADRSCNGRLIIKTGCNAPSYVTEYVMPRIIRILEE